MPEDSNFRSNLALVYLDSEISTNMLLTVEEFIPGESRTVNWQLRVIDKTLDAYALIVITDRRGNDSEISITYKGGGVSVYEKGSMDRITISPNPAIDKIVINLGSNYDIVNEILICNLKGNVIKSFENLDHSNPYEIDISDLPSASYIIRLKIADKLTSHNFKIIR